MTDPMHCGRRNRRQRAARWESKAASLKAAVSFIPSLTALLNIWLHTHNRWQQDDVSTAGCLTNRGQLSFDVLRHRKTSTQTQDTDANIYADVTLHWET